MSLHSTHKTTLSSKQRFLGDKTNPVIVSVKDTLKSCRCQMSAAGPTPVAVTQVNKPIGKQTAMSDTTGLIRLPRQSSDSDNVSYRDLPALINYH